MARRVVQGQRDLAESLLPAGVGNNAFLDSVAASLDWAAIERVLAPLRDGRLGAPPYPAVLMFKALLLQQWYGLSDPALEQALADRISFRRFVGLPLAAATPDHSTLWRFRQSLAQAGLDQAAFEAVTAQLDRRGLIVRHGTLIDASLIAAQSAPPPPGSGEGGASRLVGCAREPDADWTRRGHQHHFGYKVHVAVDAGSNLVRRAILTPCSVNETTVADRLVQGDERAVYADAAYDTRARRVALRARRIKPRLMHRANKHHPLSARQRQANRLIGRVRGRVETIFAVLKRHYGHGRARYCSLRRNAAALLLAFTAINLRRAHVLSG